MLREFDDGGNGFVGIVGLVAAAVVEVGDLADATIVSRRNPLVPIDCVDHVYWIVKWPPVGQDETTMPVSQGKFTSIT